MRSSNKLNEYLRVGYPGMYVLIAVLIAAIIAVIVWALTGTLTLSEKVTGIVLLDPPDDTIWCSVDAHSFPGAALIGTKASMRMADGKTFQGTVVSCPEEPVAAGDFKEEVNLPEVDDQSRDWLEKQLLNGNYVYPLTIAPDADVSEYEYQLTEVSIVISETRPVSFLMY